MKEIKLHPPSAFEPLLTDNVLMYFAIPMLDIYHDVHMLLNSINDNNYTRGTTIFGRTYEQFKKLIVSEDCPVEVHLKDGTFKFIFQIGYAQIGFCKGDFTDPKSLKLRKYTPSNYDLFQFDDNQPVIWKFILNEPETEEEEAFIEFVGFNLANEPVAYWSSNDNRDSNKLHLLDPITPESVELNAPFIEDPDEDDLLDEDLDTKFK
ncbi:hypothetical protein NQ778_17135 [Acinetobacter baumannii]|uniref:hypothetical protein n=1 Tax=Acinetobacter pittii TaxID=48296 RepID=UPI0019008E2E|nr:hypothetical protein [Acinetobacter pittii]MBJ8433489.1 hypothetical protein [Acinetobacter pittii]MDC4531188.1 hypothetical protein [Acinetobacter baumannii]HCA5260100.1 hypothetical protein [Acinetobacter baumannii]